MKVASKVSGLRYLLLIGGVLLLALAGAMAFALYPRVVLSTSAGGGLLLLAVAAGLASLFSPCSFPLLITLLARETSGQSKGSLYRSALAFTVGVMFFLLLLGVGIGLGAGTFITRFTFSSAAGRGLRFLTGLLLIGLGFWQLRGRSLNVAWLNSALQPLWDRQVRWRRRKSSWGYGLYGFGYILAGFG